VTYKVKALKEEIDRLNLLLLGCNNQNSSALAVLDNWYRDNTHSFIDSGDTETCKQCGDNLRSTKHRRAS